MSANSSTATTCKNIPRLVKYFLLLLILGTSLILGFFLLTYGHSWGDDFAAYLMQAQAIVDKTVDEYVMRSAFTIENSTPGLGPVIYPWGYPLALSPVYALFGHRLLAYKLVNMFFYLSYLWVVYLLFRNRLGEVLSLLITALFAVHPVMLSSFNEIGSDVLFLFLTTMTIYLIDRWIGSEDEYKSFPKGIILSAVMFAAVFTRTSGLLLLPTLFICQGIEILSLRRQQTINWRSTLLHAATPYIVFLILWLLFAIFLPAETESYLAQINFLQLYKVVYKNLIFYARDLLPEFWAPVIGSDFPLSSVLYWLLLAISLIGAFIRLRRDYAFVCYCGLTIALYLVWPYTQGMRFIYPLLPFWIYFIVQGLFWVIAGGPGKNDVGQNYLERNLGRGVKHLPGGKSESDLTSISPDFLHQLVLSVFLAVPCAFFLFSSIKLGQANLNNDRLVSGPYDNNSAPLFSYINDQTPSESVVAFFKPRAMRLLTDRDSFTLINCDQLHLADYFAAHKFKKMITTGQIEPDRLDQCAQQEEVMVELVYDLPRFSLYRIEKIP